MEQHVEELTSWAATVTISASSRGLGARPGSYTPGPARVSGLQYAFLDMGFGSHRTPGSDGRKEATWQGNRADPASLLLGLLSAGLTLGVWAYMFVWTPAESPPKPRA
jgi:hypothetical protein